MFAIDNKKRDKEEETDTKENYLNKIKKLYWNVADVRNKDHIFWSYFKHFDVISVTETCIEAKEKKKED